MPRRTRKSIAETGLTDHEWRVLRYLDQRGPTDRQVMVRDLSPPDSRIARFGGGGSNGFMPALAANWTRRLVAEGFVQLRLAIVANGELPRQYAATAAGKQFLRTVPSADE